MSFAHAGGMSSMLKEGAKSYSGIEEAVLKNIQACKDRACSAENGLI